MDIKVIKNKREEIIIDGIPVGNLLLNEHGWIKFLEIYDDFIHSEYEFKLLYEFINEIKDGYDWVDLE